MNYINDSRVVLTLDAGGTSFVFIAMQGGLQIGERIEMPSISRDLDKSIDAIKEGFYELMANIPILPAAISFAFPGSLDSSSGIVCNAGNLPAYAGGVALKDILEEEFKIPVFINNDGNLFAYGEAISGFLPYVNNASVLFGSSGCYKNLYGITLGTGIGAGVCINGIPYIGDNSNANELWLLKNPSYPDGIIDGSSFMRTLQKSYSKYAKTSDYKAFSPRDIEDIAFGKIKGNKEAAIKAYEDMGDILGNLLCIVTTLFDCLIVIGGGISCGYKLFMPSVISKMNGEIQSLDGKRISKLSQSVYDLENRDELEGFFKPKNLKDFIYSSSKTVHYNPVKRIGIGLSKLGTSEAVAMGAYAFALSKIDNKY